MDAARLVRAARHRAGLTQSELADGSGMHVQVVSRIERGHVHPLFTTVDRLLRGAGMDVVLIPRGGSAIDRAPIRELLDVAPERRLSREQMAALDLLCRRKVRFVLVGDAAARVHGAPIPVSKLEVSFGGDPNNPLRFQKAARADDLSFLEVRSPQLYVRTLENAEPFPWLPEPNMRILNRWIDAPSGFLPSVEDLMAMADPDRRELLAAVQDEIDQTSPGFRARGRKAYYRV
ncbi:MAG: helix-turn-helix domain-containing protein [Actinomycetota bacterium]